MTLTKERIIDMFKSQTKLSAFEAKEVIEAILETIKSRLESGEDVKISGFGKWLVRQKTSRPGRNPHTGERIEITARRVVTFQPSEKMRSAVDKAQLSKEILEQNMKEDEKSDTLDQT